MQTSVKTISNLALYFYKIDVKLHHHNEYNFSVIASIFQFKIKQLLDAKLLRI